MTANDPTIIYGMNKTARNNAIRSADAAKNAAKMAVPLDSVFPYERVPFDPMFFDVELADEGYPLTGG